MDMQHIRDFEKIPQIPVKDWAFIEDLKAPLPYYYRKTAINSDNLIREGVELLFSAEPPVPETALDSLKRLLQTNDIPEKKGAFPIHFQKDPSLTKEEYSINITDKGADLKASDEDGFRRAIYFLEERIRESGSFSITKGFWKRKPFIHNRISRCFFGPTNRPPFCIDELMDDVDYYPEEYLNKLAHEGVNGLWLTLYFKDLPSSFFPERGKDWGKRKEKLEKTVEKCLRYGIRIFIFLSEPKSFGHQPDISAEQEACCNEELMGAAYNHHGLHYRFFCTSTESGRRYLEESVTHIFSAVPRLGGVINIMLGEDNGCCAAYETIEAEPIPPEDLCPRCSKRDHGDIFREQALLFSRIIHKYNPQAEYIGWFYAPRQHDGSPFMKRLAHIAEKWPKEASLMFNFESGGTSMQLGKKRVVLDYSLAYIGPSELFAYASDTAWRTAAKLQVGCSHEDASVPFIPVPANLYEKYRFLYEHHVSSVMQCWYFGNYPGLMNKAAGELSFEPFPEKSSQFLLSLALPDWQKDAPKAAEAWDLFSRAYRLFPSNVNFEWYGPLHQSIVWPLHLFPVDEPISPSWLLKTYPEVAGDRIGECFGYFHTLGEGLQLCREMSELWQQGVRIMESLRASYQDDPARSRDIDLASAVGLQIKSTCNILKFYFLREDMLFYKRDHLQEMRRIVEEEITNTLEMEKLCREDCRLGYHPEAEGFIFFPEKLLARVKLLQELLEEDFTAFSLQDEWVSTYTGEKTAGVSAEVFHADSCVEKLQTQGRNLTWKGKYDDEFLYLTIYKARNHDFSIVLEPSRLWPLFTVDFYKNDTFLASYLMFVELPQVEVDYEKDNVHIRIPLELFKGFRHEGFPMRMNIWDREGSFHWTKPAFWPEGRLQFGNVKADNLGWLFLK